MKERLVEIAGDINQINSALYEDNKEKIGVADSYLVKLVKIENFSQIKKGDLFITSNSPDSCFVAKDNGKVEEPPTYGVVEADKFTDVDAAKLIEHAKSSIDVAKDSVSSKSINLEEFENLLNLIERSAPELTTEVIEAIDKYKKAVSAISTNTVMKATVKDIIEDKIYCPLPLETIPNFLGINLVSVGNIEWVKQPDNQLVSITINFNPESSN